MTRKRSKLSKIHGFKKGYVPWNKGKKIEFIKISKKNQFCRHSQSVFDRRVRQSSNGILTIENVDGTPVEQVILRPKPQNLDVVDKYLQAANNSSDACPNKLYTPKHVESLFNSEIRNHILYNSDCEGDLKFDVENEKQWGCVWRERLKCQKCDFVSKYYRLYDVVETNKRGPKSAKLNIQIQCGLITSPISNKNFRDILMISNMVPPSSSGMQKTANKVAKQVEELNKASMQDIRRNLVEENKLCGLSNEKLVRVESDCRYNNPLINSGTTPFQAGTQVVCTMSENNTSTKQIVSLFTGNKLCSVATRLRGKGIEIICPNHGGVCTANIAEDASIGNEAVYSSSCATEISDYLKISHITTDGDSKSYQGVKQVHGINVEALRDVRHLSATMKRAITRCTFSPDLFSGAKKANLKNRFALDIKARCVAELNQSFTVHQGELYKVKQHMPEVIKTIIMCYKGYCGSSCKVNSYVCAGLPSNHWIKNFIPNGSTCRMTCDDEVKVENCIRILLGTNSLNIVRFLTSTQKSEAFNRALSRCNPKNVTFSRNFPGRAHAAVHMRNHRFANSLLLLTEELGVKITAPKVLMNLKQRDRHELYMYKYRRSHVAKLKRAISRNRKYRLHASIHYSQPVFYRKGMADPNYDKNCMKRMCVTHDKSYPKQQPRKH